MTHVQSGVVTALFLFDVAETIRLDEVRDSVGQQARDSRFTAKTGAPVHVRYNPPPIACAGDAIDVTEIDGFSTSFKIYEYGVISVSLTREFTGSWDAFVAAGGELMASDALESGARDACERLIGKIGSAAVGLRTTFLSEDYYAFGVRRLDPEVDAARLISEYGGDIARLLRNERKPLSAEERDDVLRHRLSYLADDLVIVT